MAKSVLVVLAIVVLCFILVRLAPGDPAAIIAGEAGAGDPAYLDELRGRFGLDRPMVEQLWIYLKGIARLDLGYSYRQQTAVLDLIMQRLPATLLLTGSAFAFALAAGICLGAMAARHVGGWVDTLVTVLALACYAIPIFWVGLMLILVFSIALDWLPAFGMRTVGVELNSFELALDIGRHLVLPMLTLGLFYMAVYARLTRASMIEVADLDFVRTAHAKGLSPARIARVHVLRNALLPVVTVAGVQAGQLIGGAVVVETVFAWPGIGRLAFDALLQRDYPVLLGIFFVSSVLVVIVNLLTDLLYTVIDPRISVATT